MAYLGNVPAEKYISFERQVFTIVNSQTAYTLSHSVTNENDIRLVVNNIVQEPGSGKAYTASGTTLTLSAALVNGTDEMYCVFLGRAVGTVNAPAGSVSTSQLAGDAVTEAKIADGAVESEHLNNNVISGQTELSSEPADTDEFLVSDAGTIKRIDYSLIKGGGKIGQVVSTFKADAFSSTSDGFFDITGLSVSITPSATSSKILVISDLALGASDFNAFNIGFKVLRGSTDIGISTAGSNNYSGGFNFYGNDTTYAFGNAKVFLDSPSTTSATTYKVQGTKLDSSGTFYLNRRGSSTSVGGASSITVMEVLA